MGGNFAAREHLAISGDIGCHCQVVDGDGKAKDAAKYTKIHIL